MQRGIDNGLLVTDLNCNHWNILNPGNVDSPSLVHNNDPRLSNPRLMIDGSVTDASVADDAAIVQSKLALTGDIPVNWFGTGSTDAARADLAENHIHRDALNGYPTLGLDGKLQTNSTPTSGTGTVKIIDIELPFGEVITVDGAVTTTRIFSGYWEAQQPESWFGNVSGVAARPVFGQQQFTVDMIPDLDASKITSGVLPIDQLPVAIGVGIDHAPGGVPAPGVSDGTSQPDDYLARDMTYRPMTMPVSNQPTLPNPSITIQSYRAGAAYLNITSSVPGTTIFYKTTAGDDAFVEIAAPSPTESPTLPNALPILVPVGATVSSYIAKIGYNNSNIVMFTVPPVPAG